MSLRKFILTQQNLLQVKFVHNLLSRYTSQGANKSFTFYFNALKAIKELIPSPDRSSLTWAQIVFGLSNKSHHIKSMHFQCSL